MVKVNLKNQEIRNFETIPNGVYRVEVDRCEERQSAANEPNIFFLFKTTDVLTLRQPNENQEGLVGRTVMHGCSLQEKALWNLYRTLIALGGDPGEIDDESYELDVDEWVGKECVITVGSKVYQGQNQNQVLNLRALNEQESGRLS